MDCDKTKTNVKTVSIEDLAIWGEAEKDRTLLSLVLELTERCNNNCVHCYINQPAEASDVKRKELSFKEIQKIIDEAVSLGTLWLLLSGGEPLLRPDFSDIYVYARKKGMLVSIFTNGSLVTDEHIKLFKKYPPRDIEVTVYGVTEKIHKRVTRKNTYRATMEGIERLVANRLPVTLKTTVMQSNVEEIGEIEEFCREKTDTAFRFDPFLQFRLDRDSEKNRRITAERLSFEKILQLEKRDPARFKLLQDRCGGLDLSGNNKDNPRKIFRCKGGINSCCVDHRGMLKLCSSLNNKNCVYDLRRGTLTEGWEEFVPKVLKLESNKESFLRSCGSCEMHDLCSWCPAHADLETGELDESVEYFCNIVEQRRVKLKIP